MSPTPPTPDSPASRGSDPAHDLDLFIDDDDPGGDPPPLARPAEGPPCAP